MRTFLVIVVGFIVNLATHAQPPVLVAEYRFETLPSGTGTVAPYFVNNLVLSYASNFRAGTGLSGPVGFTQGASLTNPIDKSYWGSNWNPTTFDVNDWFGDTLMPVVGQTLVIDKITFWERRSTTGPTSWQLRRNPYTATITAGGTTVGSTSPQTPFGFKSISAGLPSTATLVGLRLYGYGASGTAGTWRIDTLRIYGHLLNVFNLPIELISFEGVARERKIRLTWSTASEMDNDHFTIEKSMDGVSWQTLGTIPGAGTSLVRLDYALSDPDPVVGWNYYRLSQTDIDGTTVECGTTAVLWYSRDGPIEVYSTDGRLIRGFAIEHPDLPRGQIYILRDEFGGVRRHYVP